MRNILRCAFLCYAADRQPRTLIWLQVLLVIIGYILGLAYQITHSPQAFAILLVTLIFVSFFLASPVGRICGHSAIASRRRLFLLSFPFYRSETIIGEWLAFALSGSSLLIAGIIGFVGAIQPESDYFHIAVVSAFFWAVFALAPLYILISSTRAANHPAVPLVLTFLLLPILQFVATFYAGPADSILAYLPGTITLQSIEALPSASLSVALYEMRASLFWGILFALITTVRFRDADLLAGA